MARRLPILSSAWFVTIIVLVASSAGTAGAQQSSFSSTLKKGLREGPARQLAPLAVEAAPRLAWAMGWDFQDRQWKLNEFSNQMTHITVGNLCSRFLGPSTALGIALTTEVVQFFRNDHMQLKLLDRARDVSFYVLLS